MPVNSTTVSIAETEYAPCACSPTGKVKRVSMPYAPGGTAYWTVYEYDARGRTLSVTPLGSAGSTTYVYEGNTVKGTDAAGKWKKYETDAFGNLVKVWEPNPAGQRQYNTRGQLTRQTGMGVDLEYRFSSTANDGRLWQRKDWVSGEEVTYQYDQLGRLIAAETIEPYFYSARNERIVVRRTGSPDEVNFYGADGLLLGVYRIEQHPNNQSGWKYPFRIDEKERVYFGGRLIGVGSGTGGTLAVVTDRLGSVVKKDTQTYLYYPYGQEIGGATANDTAKYATYTRDSWSGLDYAMNRFYKNEWGRFTSPIPTRPAAASQIRGVGTGTATS